MTERIGQRLGNYRLTRLLGKGGFAEVYLGEHVRLNTRAAVKVLYTRLGGSDEVESFQKEAQTIAHLDHPHIVRVLDFDVANDTPFLVMSYATGGTLRQRHPKGTILPLPTIITYVKQIADALQYAHDQHIVHRDIKPENMLVGGRNELLLSDFGIAIIAQSSRYQGTQDMAGTIAYMAPEQIQAHPRPASDQYSLGVVVYEWLSGDRPFHGSYSEIAVKHTIVPPPSLREKLPMLSPDVEQVVMTALAKEPKERFASVQAFANALEQANAGWDHPVSSRGEGGADVGRGPLRSPAFPVERDIPLQSPVVGVSSTTPVDIQPTAPPSNHIAPPTAGETPPLSSFASTRPASSDKEMDPPVVTPPDSISTPAASVPNTASVPPAPAPPIPTKPASPPSTPDIANSSPPDTLVVPPTRRISRRTVLVGLAGLAVAGGGLVWVLAPHPLYTYRGNSFWVDAVAWSPDGRRIASGSGDGTVQVWDATDGGNAFTYRGHPNGAVLAVAWSPDGRRIASGSTDNTVQVWDAATGGNVFTYRGHSNWVFAVAWSPDGRRIASGSYDGIVQVWDADNGGNVYPYRGHSGGVQAVAWSPDGKRIASGSTDNTVQVWVPG